MIYISTVVPVLDNSGGLLVKCIKVYGEVPRGRASLGDMVLISVKTYKPNKKVKKGQLFKAIFACSKHSIMRHGGYYVQCQVNGVVLLSARMTPLGNRILRPIFRETRRRGFLGILGLAPFVV